MKTIVFILTSINDTHMLKRVDEFMRFGYDVRIYGFARSNNIGSAYNLPIRNLGMMPEKQYAYRLVFMYNALRKIRKEIPENSVMFYFGQDIAMISRLVFRKPYIYEECDLSFSYINNSLIQNVLHHIDRRIIRKSLHTILTSDGFCRFHFPERRPDNVSIIPNKLDPKCQDFDFKGSGVPLAENIRIGYVGKIRFNASLRFLRYASEVNNCSLHFYGVGQWFSKESEREFQKLCDEGKIECYGRFKSPEDLAGIYSNIDMTVAPYDVDTLNPRWAEPNKLYEAIYYETPIVVSAHCYLADVVKELGVGYAVDTTSESAMSEFFEHLTVESLLEKKEACRKLGKKFCLNDNTAFLESMKKVVSSC